MKYSVFVTNNFKKEFKKLYKKYPSLKQDIEILINNLQTNPDQGFRLENNCYKIRISIASKNKGKRGGARVITCVKIIETTVFLLSLYDKSGKENISDKELDKLLKLAGLL